MNESDLPPAAPIGEGALAAGPASPSFLDDYRALGLAGIVDCSARSRIELTGADRIALLHNLCSNDIKGLAEGDRREAFLLNAKGHVVGHVQVLRPPNRLILESSPGQEERVIQSLDRYIIREDAQLAPRGDAWGELLLSGADWSDRLPAAGFAGGTRPEEWPRVFETEWHGIPVIMAEIDWLPFPGRLLFFDSGRAAEIRERLLAAGGRLCSADAFDAARLEAGTPWYDLDVTDAQLPQEVDRDSRSISFTKGCYIGQETVARIDALGHVNRVLRGVRFLGATCPASGTELTFEGEAAGRVTSAAYSPKLRSPLALAYVRRGRHLAGTQLDSPCGRAEVVSFPLV